MADKTVILQKAHVKSHVTVEEIIFLNRYFENNTEYVKCTFLTGRLQLYTILFNLAEAIGRH